MAVDATATQSPRRRLSHALLALLLLLAATGAALHPYALDEHAGGHPCGVCLASASGRAAPPPAIFTLALPGTAAPPADAELALPAAQLPASYRARAPPV